MKMGGLFWSIRPEMIFVNIHFFMQNENMAPPFLPFSSTETVPQIMQKAEARKLFSNKRKELTSKEVNVYQDLLLIRLQELDLPYCNILHTYLPIYDRNEPDPMPMVDWLRFRDPGMKVAYPKIQLSDLSMTHYVTDEHSVFTLNEFGIAEPDSGMEVDAADIDMVIIPLLCFDHSGNRVGYGKGFYDRFLSKCRTEVLKIGLSFFPPIESIEDVNFFDKKLDLCITPERVYAF
jgi:5-formyltetrahydrofolate cyclo-ligase